MAGRTTSRCPPATFVRQRDGRHLGGGRIAGIVTATMTAAPRSPHAPRLPWRPQRGAHAPLADVLRRRAVTTSTCSCGATRSSSRRSRTASCSSGWTRSTSAGTGPDSYLGARRAVRRVLDRIDAEVLHVHYLTGYGFWAWLSGLPAVRDHGLGLGRLPHAADVPPPPPLRTAEPAQRRGRDRRLGRPGRRGDRCRRAARPDHRRPVRRRHRPLQPDAPERVVAAADRYPDEAPGLLAPGHLPVEPP